MSFVRPLQLGSLCLDTNVWLAPLAGWTSLAFREQVRALGGVGLAVTEVVSAPALLAGGRRPDEYTATSPLDWPLAVQVNARTPLEAAAAAQWVEANGYAAVDFNLGCPVRKITRKGGGAALGRSAALTAAVVGAAVRAVQIPVTAKIRLGWDDTELTAPAVARALESEGVSAVVVHGRSRAQAFSGQVNIEGIAATVQAVSIPIIANGDVLSAAGARAVLEQTGAAGVMIGRGAIERPWIFRECIALSAGVAIFEPTVHDRAAFARAHWERLAQTRPERVAAALFRKILCTYVLAAGAPSELAAQAVRIESERCVQEVLCELRRVVLVPRSGGLVKAPRRPVEHW